MIFVARQLEKTVEHSSELYILIVNLRKAYNSIPWSALWCVLEKVGVPPVMLRIIQSLHDGMTASVRVGGQLTDSVAVTNGLRLGCTLAAMLFSLYFAAVIEHWRSCCPAAGVSVLYKIGRKLEGDRTTKRSLLSTSVTGSEFADDAALYATSRKVFEEMTSTIISCRHITVERSKAKASFVRSQVIVND